MTYSNRAYATHILIFLIIAEESLQKPKLKFSLLHLLYQTFYVASGNQTMPQLINLFRARLDRLQMRTILIPERTEQSIGEHEAIFQALQAQSCAAADQAARAHMNNLRLAIQKNWQLIRL
jgi:DNA-binding FadR family transcriptional regulator